MAKMADIVGRFEAFSVSTLLLVLGYIQQACSKNVQTFAAAQVFHAAGKTGLKILEQIFIADTSSLLNRALFLSLPVTPFLLNVWIGPIIAGSILKNSSWRWGYAMWAVILPVMFLPLAIALILNTRRSKRSGVVTEVRQRTNVFEVVKD